MLVVREEVKQMVEKLISKGNGEILINPENVKLGIVRTAVPLWDKTSDTSFVAKEIDLQGGITIEDLAKAAPKHVWGFEIVTRIKGTVKVDGNEVKMLSEHPIADPFTVFINGKLRGDKKYIETRTGTRMAYVEGVDRNIFLA